jgi:hypothetical protein
MLHGQVTVQTPNGSVCRFFKPEETHAGRTAIDETGNLRLHRPVGCEYVNAFNSTIMSVLKCNHDAKFVLCSDSKNAAAYVCKYCMKKQNPVQNEVALSVAAFAKAASRADTLPSRSTATERGRKILGSMLYTVTNGQEIAAPMAALYILRESPFWFSHEPVRINLEQMLKKDGLSEEISVPAQLNVSISSTTTLTRPRTLLDKYWNRSSAIENESFIDFCELYESINSAANVEGTADTEIQNPHRKARATKVVVVCGRQIPDIGTHVDYSTLNFYYTAVLTLFKPHRKSSLLRLGETVLTTYQAFAESSDVYHVAQLKAFEERLRDYYCADSCVLDNNDESAEVRLLRTRMPATHPWSGIENDRTRPDDLNISVGDDFAGDDDGGASAVLSLSLLKYVEKAQDAVNNVPNLRGALDQAVNDYQTVDALRLDEGFDYDNYATNIMNPGAAFTDKNCFGTTTFVKSFPDAATRLEKLRECFAPVPWKSPTEEPQWTHDSLPVFPTIGMVSEAFQLNFWQHIFFEVAARHLLFEYSKDIESSLDEAMYPITHSVDPYLIKPQLIAYLGGEAGTGKSTVIHALLAIAKKWGREGSVETLAFTGVAAINIKGRTMHSARHLQLSGAESEQGPTIEMKARFSRVILTIIDEISMTDQALLGGTNGASRSLSTTPQFIMGGRHTILSGDLLQLPSVAGSPCELFHDKLTLACAKSDLHFSVRAHLGFVSPPDDSCRQRKAGFEVYAAINFVVFLTENMRATADQQFAMLLADLRWGNLSNTELAALNARVYDPLQSNSRSSEISNNFFKPVIVSVNDLRCALNRDAIFQVARRHQIPVYECDAVGPIRSQVVLQHIMNANDDQTERIPMRLLFYIGMPVMITRKHPDLVDSNVIANGIMGTIVGFSPSPESLSFASAEVFGVTVLRFEQQPRLLLIKIQGEVKSLVSSFPAGVIGLPPLRTSIKLTNMKHLSQNSITIQQFAVVAAFSCTTEKLQGQTCRDGIIVTPLDHRRKNLPPQSLYVALSRSVSLDKVILTKPITREYLAKFRPTTLIANEMQRLINLIELPLYTSFQQRQAFTKWKSTQRIVS